MTTTRSALAFALASAAFALVTCCVHPVAATLEMRTGTSIRIASSGSSNPVGFVTATDWANSQVLVNKVDTFPLGFWDAFALDQVNGRLFYLHSKCSKLHSDEACLRVWRYRGKDNTAVSPFIESQTLLTGPFKTQTFTAMAYDHVKDRLILAPSGYDDSVYAMNVTTGMIDQLCHVMGATAISFPGSSSFNSYNQVLQYCFDSCFNVRLNATETQYYCDADKYELPKGASIQVLHDDTVGPNDAAVFEFFVNFGNRTYFYSDDATKVPPPLREIDGVMSHVFNGTTEWGPFLHLDPLEADIWYATVYHDYSKSTESMALWRSTVDSVGFATAYSSPPFPYPTISFASTDPIMHDFYTGNRLRV